MLLPVCCRVAVVFGIATYCEALGVAACESTLLLRRADCAIVVLFEFSIICWCSLKNISRRTGCAMSAFYSCLGDTPCCRPSIRSSCFLCKLACRS